MYSIFSILTILEKEVADLAALMERTGYSESKIRGIISNLRKDGVRNGFEVVTRRGRGYELIIEEQGAYQTYARQLAEGQGVPVEDKTIRIAFILYFLLSHNGYCSIEKIAEALGIHRQTVSNGLKEVAKRCQEFDLELVTRKHYGVLIAGREQRKRQLFSKTMAQIKEANQGLHDTYNELKKDQSFQQLLTVSLADNDIVLTESAVEAILHHLAILLIRVQDHNFVTDIKTDSSLISEPYYKVAGIIIDALKKRFDVQISSLEEELIAAQLFGNAVLEYIPQAVKAKVKNEIVDTLRRIDKEYRTDYAEDEDLAAGLLLHVYPLIIRLTCDLELSNVLFQSMPAQFTSSYVIAIRFIELHPVLSRFRFSRDEIGYLAIHFASYLERKNLDLLEEIGSILLVYGDVRGEINFSKLKLERAFPKAKVKVIHHSRVAKYRLEDIDLILTTNPEFVTKKDVLVVKEVIDEVEIEGIKNDVLFNYQRLVKQSVKVEDLFQEQLFFRDDAKDYHQLLTKYSKLLEQQEYAEFGFADSVLERERRLSTVYEHGLAGPHSIMPRGLKDCIAVILLAEPLIVEEKEVRCIFLINIRKGHMILHQGISRLIVSLMENKPLLNKVSQATEFSEFYQLLNEGREEHGDRNHGYHR